MSIEFHKKLNTYYTVRYLNILTEFCNKFEEKKSIEKI